MIPVSFLEGGAMSLKSLLEWKEKKKRRHSTAKKKSKKKRKTPPRKKNGEFRKRR